MNKAPVRAEECVACEPLPMPSREDPAQRGRRRAARIGLEVGASLRDARRAAGLSQVTVARRVAVSQATVSRLERDGSAANIKTVGVLAAVVGLDLVVHLYPGGAPVRDVAHSRLLGRLQASLPAVTGWRTEVPLPNGGDQRAIDAVVRIGNVMIGFELETRLTDAQAIARRVSLKQRDAGIDRMVLVLADTRANRVALRAAEGTLRAAFPMNARPVLDALRGRVPPHENGIVLI